MRDLRFVTVLVCLALGRAQGVHHTSFEGYPAIVLSNSKLELTVMTRGSTLASVTLADDTEKLTPCGIR